MSIDDEKLLLAEYTHFGDGIFKNEEIGERRIEFFLTLTTAVLGGVVLLLTSDHARLSESTVRKIAIAALLGLLLMGLVTFSRILQRDKVTEEYKSIQRFLREELRKRSVSLEEYALPFTGTRHKLLRGGIALTLSVINSLVLAFLVAIWSAGLPANATLATGSFFLLFVVHALALRGKSASTPDQSQFYRAGAGAIILNGKGQVLAMKRKHTSDAWQLPQGGMNLGESPVEAIVREIREETGIKTNDLHQLLAEPVLLAYELPRAYRSEKTGRGQVHHWFLFRYDGQESGITLGDRSEFDDWKWTSFPQLAAEVATFRRDVYLELLRRWASELGA